MNVGFTFLPSYYDALKDLPDEIRHEILDAMLEYAFAGALPELTGSAKTIFTLIRPNIDASMEHYLHGKRGGRPRKDDTGKK